MKTTIIEIAGHVCHFREPRRIGPRNRGAYQMLKEEFPDVERFHQALLLMGAAYVPDADEKGIDPTRELAGVARKNDYVFFDAFQAFVAAFLEFFQQEDERESKGIA